MNQWRLSLVENFKSTKMNILAILTFIFFALFLTGCGLESENELLMDEVDDIKEISISKSTDYNKLNNDFFATFQDAKELDVWKRALNTAKREKVKLEEVNFDLLVDGYLLQIYLGEEGEKSAFFFIGHEDKVYFTPEEITIELRDTIELKENKD